MNFFITKHCKDRYKERVLGNNHVPDILMNILKELRNGTNVTSKFSEEYPRFILYLKERYTDKNYNFIKFNSTIYILTKRKGTSDLYDVLTCYTEGPQLTSFKNTSLNKTDIYIRLKLLKNKK